MTQNNERQLIMITDYLWSGWTVMLALGALSEQLQLPSLAISFWSSLLIMAIIREATPYGLYNPMVYLYKDKKKKAVR